MSTPVTLPNPIDESRRIGTVIAVLPDRVTINLPNADAEGQLYHGELVPRGEVGEYVCFARNDAVILGRITRVQLLERDRLSVEPRIGSLIPVNPLGEVTLLTDVNLVTGDVTGAVSAPPKIGIAAYSISLGFLQWILESSTRKKGEITPVKLHIGDVAGLSGAQVLVTPERLFGRHCAVLGVTGGGKSYTIARLVEECAQHKSKIILIDATGEFSSLNNSVLHCSIGSEKDSPATSIESSCSYQKLEEKDLFAFFTPSPQSQAPILREAIRSLKLAQCPNLPDGMINVDGVVVKKQRSKTVFMQQCRTHMDTMESPLATFDIEKLTTQISHECVYATGTDDLSWGKIDDKTLGYCMSLLLRIESMVKSPVLAPIFKPGTLPPIQDKIDHFLSNEALKLMRVSLRYLSFSQSVRPIVVNAIGRHLLKLARDGVFKEHPVVVILDEAHQFLGKSVGDEGSTYALDAFDLIAKEGRKYGLTLCLATQRPRDIQEGVLSQMGTMVVHRLTHGADREVVERAARDVEKSIAAFLPTLSPGQALLLGADFPVPIPIQIREPVSKPESKGPDYQRFWAN